MTICERTLGSLFGSSLFSTHGLRDSLRAGEGVGTNRRTSIQIGSPSLSRLKTIPGNPRRSLSQPTNPLCSSTEGVGVSCLHTFSIRVRTSKSRFCSDESCSAFVSISWVLSMGCFITVLAYRLLDVFVRRLIHKSLSDRPNPSHPPMLEILGIGAGFLPLKTTSPTSRLFPRTTSIWLLVSWHRHSDGAVDRRNRTTKRHRSNG